MGLSLMEKGIRFRENCKQNIYSSMQPFSGFAPFLALFFSRRNKRPPFQVYFILFYFIEKNGSIINTFHTITPSSLKLGDYTPTHQEIPIVRHQVLWLGRSKHDKTKPKKKKKQTTLLNRQIPINVFQFNCPIQLSNSIQGACNVIQYFHLNRA